MATFDSTADKLTITATGLGSPTPWTMACWAKLAVDTNTWVQFIGADNGGSTYNYIGTHSDGTQYRRICASNETAGATLTVGTWYYAAMTWDNAATDNFYLGVLGGGALTEAPTSTGGGTLSASFTVYVGNNAFNNNINGDISYARIWTNVLSLAELEAERLSATAVKTTGLWASWPLTADFNDVSGNGRNLTSAGTPVAAAGPTLTTAVNSGAFALM